MQSVGLEDQLLFPSSDAIVRTLGCLLEVYFQALSCPLQSELLSSQPFII